MCAYHSSAYLNANSPSDTHEKLMDAVLFATCIIEYASDIRSINCVCVSCSSGVLLSSTNGSSYQNTPAQQTFACDANISSTCVLLTRRIISLSASASLTTQKYHPTHANNVYYTYSTWMSWYATWMADCFVTGLVSMSMSSTVGHGVANVYNVHRSQMRLGRCQLVRWCAKNARMSR